jgi:hypothetical protein
MEKRPALLYDTQLPHHAADSLEIIVLLYPQSSTILFQFVVYLIWSQNGSFEQAISQ